MTLLQMDRIGHVTRANTLSQEVFNIRKQRLGKEHPYTLWATCNFARVKARRGSLENDQTLVHEAKEMLEDGISVAKRNFGHDFIGTLFGRQHLANVFFLQKKYARAEEEFVDIMERQKRLPAARNGTHPDRIGTMGMLIECYESQHRYEGAMATCDIVLQELDAIGAQHHSMRRKAVRKRKDLELLLNPPSHDGGDPLSEGMRRRRTSVFVGHATSIEKDQHSHSRSVRTPLNSLP